MKEKKLNTLKHLLQEENILNSFFVNRKMNKSELSQIVNSMGMSMSDMNSDDLDSIVSNLSEIELACGEVPGTKNSSSKSLNQFKQNYSKLQYLMSLSLCVVDLLMSEDLTNEERIFILNKCTMEIKNQGK